MVADICACNVSDSVALLQFLRAKSSKELLSINQVKREGRVWGQCCPLNGVVDKSCHSLIYFDLGLGQMAVGDS